MSTHPFRITAALAVLLLAPTAVFAQAQAAGRAEVALPQTLRAAALIDLTGYWVAYGSEDWRYRWIVADAGDVPGVPLNAAGRLTADRWDPELDQRAGLQCRAYGAAGVMRLPGRLHITWQDDNALKIETDAGQQTRLLTFGKPLSPGSERSWQGHSAAVWQTSAPLAEALRAPAGEEATRVRRHTGQLRVRTTNMLAGYLRKNGVPYSEQTVLTEYYTRAVSPTNEEWLIVTQIVDDPINLNEPFVTSSNFKKEADGSKWSPTTCNTREPR